MLDYNYNNMELWSLGLISTIVCKYVLYVCNIGKLVRVVCIGDAVDNGNCCIRISL